MQDGNTPLHLASWKCHKEVVQVLLHGGADTNAKNKVTARLQHRGGWGTGAGRGGEGRAA